MPPTDARAIDRTTTAFGPLARIVAVAAVLALAWSVMFWSGNRATTQFADLQASLPACTDAGQGLIAGTAQAGLPSQFQAPTPAQLHAVLPVALEAGNAGNHAEPDATPHKAQKHRAFALATIRVLRGPGDLLVSRPCHVYCGRAPPRLA